MTTATKKANAARTIVLPSETWKPIAQWLASFLDQDRRTPRNSLPLTQMQAIADQARRHGIRSKRPLRLTMPDDSWNTLADRIPIWADNPAALTPACPPPPADALSALLDLIEAEDPPRG